MATANSNDGKREQASKPDCGYSDERHKSKAGRSAPNSGGTPHTEKGAYDQKHGRSGLSQPNAGPHDRGKDRKNISKPDGGDADVPKNRQHLDKKAFEDARKHEPKPAGKTNSSGHKFATTKRD